MPTKKKGVRKPARTNRRPAAPVAKAEAGMLIRKPAGEVFEAIVNPDPTTQFWFTKSSGRLETGKKIKWEWRTSRRSSSTT